MVPRRCSCRRATRLLGEKQSSESALSVRDRMLVCFCGTAIASINVHKRNQSLCNKPAHIGAEGYTRGKVMKKILKIGIISFAFGLILFGTESVNAQNRTEARRERREEVRDARRDYRKDIRKGENPREARREFREDRRDARRDYRNSVRRGRTGWYYYNNGRSVFYPFARYYYRNGRFIRRF